MTMLNKLKVSELEDVCFELKEEFSSSKRLATVSQWKVANTKQTLIDLVNSGEIGNNVGIDISHNEWLNAKFKHRKSTALMMTNVPAIGLNENYSHNIANKELTWNRLTRFFGGKDVIRETFSEHIDKKGNKLPIKTSRPFRSLQGMPMVYVDFAEDNSKNEAQHQAYLKSVSMIKKGITINGEKYEFYAASASQLRQLAGVFVKANYSLSIDYVNKHMSTHGDSVYAAFISSLTGSDAILEVMTYGAYSMEFSNMFYKWFSVNVMPGMPGLAEFKRRYPEANTKPILVSVSMFLARAGLSLTSSIPFGNDWKVLHMGEILTLPDNMVATYKEMMVMNDDGLDVHALTDEQIQNNIDHWKTAKHDGQNIIRASKVIEEFVKYGITVTMEDVCGKLLQYRWAGVKGTAYVVDDSFLDDCVLPDGVTHPYVDYDMVVEHNSWKFSPTQFYVGELAPEFELVSMDKAKFTSFMNYQFFNALDGLKDDIETTLMAYKLIFDNSLNLRRQALTDATVMKATLGITDKTVNPLEDFGIDEYASSIVTKIAAVLDIDEAATYEPYVRRKYLGHFSKDKDRMAIGKIEVEGANRFGITDPTPFFRTDLAVMRKNGRFDIVISRTNQTALTGAHDVYWAGKSGDCLLFRSPCVHAGESQKAFLQSDNSIRDYIQTGYGVLNTKKLICSSKHIIILSCWNNMLEGMGGADTDGDTFLIVTEEFIVAMRPWGRTTYYAVIKESNNPNEGIADINKESIKDNMVRSLKNNGIGLITNYATTWRDIQHYAEWCLATDNELDSKVTAALFGSKKRAQKNLTIYETWVDEDPSILPVASMDNYDPKSVIATCEIVLQQLRVLQEMAINTAKSGVFVEFGSENSSVNNYDHLTISVRASWHKPTYDIEKRYTSKSTMGRLSAYAKNEWAKLYEESKHQTRSLFPVEDKYFDQSLLDLAKEIDNLRAYFGVETDKIRQREDAGEITEDEHSMQFKAIAEDMHSELTAMAVEHGTDIIATIAYDATMKSSRSDGKGASFIWHCFFDEFLHTIKYNKYNSDIPANERLYAVSLSGKYAYTVFEDGEVTIADKKVFLDDREIGYCGLEDGEYDMAVIDDKMYVKKLFMLTPVDELNATLNERKETEPIVIRLQGFGYNEDKINGGVLDKIKLMDYIASDTGRFLIRVKTVNMNCFSKKPKINFFVRYANDENGKPLFMNVGCIEDVQTRTLARALNNKLLKVRFHETVADEPLSILSLIVERVVCDELQQQ